MIEIGYTTDNISKQYVSGIQACGTQDEMRAFLKDWEELVPDAVQAVKDPAFSWKEYERGCKLERKGKYAGDEWAKLYGTILMPAVVLFIGIKAMEYKAPEGVVFHQAIKAGVIKKVRGVYVLKLPKRKP